MSQKNGRVVEHERAHTFFFFVAFCALLARWPFFLCARCANSHAHCSDPISCGAAPLTLSWSYAASANAFFSGKSGKDLNVDVCKFRSSSLLAVFFRHTVTDGLGVVLVEKKNTYSLKNNNSSGLETKRFSFSTPIAVLTTVQYPTSTATIDWPSIWPESWIASGVKNDGSLFAATLKVQAQASAAIVRSKNLLLFSLSLFFFWSIVMNQI